MSDPEGPCEMRQEHGSGDRESLRDAIRDNLEHLRREEEERQEEDPLDAIDEALPGPSDSDLDLMQRRVEANVARMNNEAAALLIMEIVQENIRWTRELRDQVRLQAKRYARLVPEVRRLRVLVKTLLVWPSAIKKMFWVFVCCLITLMTSRAYEFVTGHVFHWPL